MRTLIQRFSQDFKSHRSLALLATSLLLGFTFTPLHAGTSKAENNKSETEKVTTMTNAKKVSATGSKSCPEFMNAEFRRLHSDEMVNLCSLYQGKPMLIVNTASHCGFTSQFKDLEAFYQQHKDQGVTVIGFASDSFNQEAKSEEAAAGICYENFGVTFTMLAPTPVKGAKANSVFKGLAEKSQAPQWNFNKYLVLPNKDSVEVKHFSSPTNPRSISF